MILLKILPFVLILFVSCSRVKTINKKEHIFNNPPKKIVFLQVPGLSEEHLAYIRYQKPNLARSIWPEKFSCFGKSWRHNLYEVRPGYSDGLLSQITGLVNSAKTCEKFSTETIWSNLAKAKYKSVFIQRGKGGFFDEALKCNKDFFKNTVVLDSRPHSKPSENMFHFQRTASYEVGKIYKDKACNKKGCFSTNIELFDHGYSSLRGNGALVYQDMTIYHALKSNNKEKFLESLNNLERLVEHLLKTVNTSEGLVIVAGTSPIEVLWPKKDKQWEKLNILNSKSNELMSPVWARGALAENFCGIYSESDIFNRIFWRPTKTDIPFVDAI